jgi:hypothetical protein
MTAEPWAPPPSRRSRGRTVLLGVGIIFAIVAGINVLAFAISAFSDDDETATREDVEQLMIEEGLPPDVASCIAEKQPEVIDAESMVDNNKFVSDLLTCSGVPADISECAIDELSGMMGHELSADEFIAFEQSLEAKDRQSFAEITMVCGGFTKTEAACVTDAMAQEFDGIFEQARVILTAEQQIRLEELQIGCIN